MTGLYIHIPFCKRKCFYCDFISVEYEQKKAEDYVDALQNEMSCYKGLKISTVYLGGGTPSALNVLLLEKLINNIKDTFDLTSLEEFTVELNPESALEDKLLLLKKLNVSRISFGLQSVDDGELFFLGRVHNFDIFKSAYNNAIKSGFDNINIDLIYGLERQNVQKWIETLTAVLKFQPQHISLYPLTIEENTVFYKNNITVNTDMQRQQYDITCAIMKDNGFVHYELSNWAKKNKCSKHNTNYWLNKEYIGLGAAAASYFKRFRFKNTDDIDLYISSMLHAKNCIVENEFISDELYNVEQIMLGLRLYNGVDIKYFSKKADILNKFINDGFLRLKNGRISLTRKSLFISNSIISEFM